MATKKGAGGEPQEYDTSTGQYGGGKTYRQNTPNYVIAREERKRQTNPHLFKKALVEAKKTIPLDKRWRVDSTHVEGHYSDCFMYISDIGSVVAVEPSGNIISVCKAKGDTVSVSDLLRIAVKEGGDRLDAFGPDLYAFYTKNGFEPVSWTPFNEEYAPDEWKEAKRRGLDVKPESVVFYKYTGKKYEEPYDDFIRRVAPEVGEDGYSDAERKRDKEIENARKGL